MFDNSDDKIYDVAIVGGGIIGATTLFLLSRYTNISKIILVEREAEQGLLILIRKTTAKPCILVILKRIIH